MDIIIINIIINVIINAFQHYRMSDELKTEELETSEVLTVCQQLAFKYLKHLNRQKEKMSLQDLNHRPLDSVDKNFNNCSTI